MTKNTLGEKKRVKFALVVTVKKGIRLGKDMELAEVVYDTEDVVGGTLTVGLRRNQRLANQK